jgi:hypothetical protein
MADDSVQPKDYRKINFNDALHHDRFDKNSKWCELHVDEVY